MENRSINKNWALIESMGYTIQRALGGDFPAQKFEAVPLQESIELKIAFAAGGDCYYPTDYNGPGADLGLAPLAALNTVRNSGYYRLAKELDAFSASCIFCYCVRQCGGGFYCRDCATRACTPEITRACNGETKWAAAQRGDDMDKAMAEIIETTPAIQTEIERRALAALIPATPTTTRRQSGRL